jgi:radical SAM protein with 4Fe4S-binding SPASM domain
MISWTRLLFNNNKKSWGDRLRYKNLSHQPVIVWNITASCNLNCFHCYLDSIRESPRRGQSLNETHAKKIILDLAQFKVPVILFSGGEPLLRKDIFSLADFAHKCGIRPALSTNGILITPGVARKIKKAKFKYVGISIDGLPKTHDKLRQEKGSFRHALSGIRNCQSYGIKTGVRFTLLKDNFDDLEFIFHFVKKENIERLCIYHLVYSGRARKEDDLSFKEKRNALELILKYANDFYKRMMNIEILTVDNHADGVWIYEKLKETKSKITQRALKLLKINKGNRSGISLACIDYKGDVFPDQFTRNYPIGNVLQRRFQDVWLDESHPFLYKLRNRKYYIKGRCKNCRFFGLCNGNMRCRAEQVFGDIWQEDPACYLSDEEIASK